MKEEKHDFRMPVVTVRINDDLGAKLDQSPFVQKKVARAKEILAKTGNPFAKAAKDANQA